MDTTTQEPIDSVRQRRRRHSAAFKAEAIRACCQPGVSVAAVALARGLNANLLRRWVKLAESEGALLIQPAVTLSRIAIMEPGMIGVVEPD